MDHDRLFKELLGTFFLDFLRLFLPQLAGESEEASLVPLDKEVFTDVTAGERHEVDLLVRACLRDRASFFLIHVETQASAQTDFSKRMFRYLAAFMRSTTCLSIRSPSSPTTLPGESSPIASRWRSLERRSCASGSGPSSSID
jgi:hypothetical protein